MPSYGGKSALILECPKCGERGEHSVIKTDPSIYYWSKEKTILFKRLVGRDISYRRRTKKCSKCKSNFESVETPAVFFEALMTEIDRLENEIHNLKNIMFEAGNKLLVHSEQKAG